MLRVFLISFGTLDVAGLLSVLILWLLWCCCPFWYSGCCGVVVCLVLWLLLGFVTFGVLNVAGFFF